MNRLLVVYKAPVHSVYLFFIFEGVLNFIKKIGCHLPPTYRRPLLRKHELPLFASR